MATWNIEEVDVDLPVFAIISPDIANSVLPNAGSDFERLLDVTLGSSVYKALDAHAAIELITAATDAGNTQTFSSSARGEAAEGAVTQLELVGFAATDVFVNPVDHEALALATDGTGRYLFACPTDAMVPRAWSMKLTSTPAVTEGTAIVASAPVAATAVLREDLEFAVDADEREPNVRYPTGSAWSSSTVSAVRSTVRTLRARPSARRRGINDAPRTNGSSPDRCHRPDRRDGGRRAIAPSLRRVAAQRRVLGVGRARAR